MSSEDKVLVLDLLPWVKFRSQDTVDKLAMLINPTYCSGTKVPHRTLEAGQPIKSQAAQPII